MFFVSGIFDLFYFFQGPIAALMTERNQHVLVGAGLLLTFVLSYLLGSVNFALVISQARYHDDVREHGSGNAGTTNVLRTYGKKAAILTFLGDGLKGAVAICLSCLLFAGVQTMDIQGVAYIAAFACIFGHIFPCFAHFKGGKGFATLAVCVLFLNPTAFLILAVLFFSLVALTKYVSLGSVMVALFFPILLSTAEFTLVPALFETYRGTSFEIMLYPSGISVLMSLFIGALIVWAHRGNLKRISDRTERKLSLGKKKQTEREAEHE